MPDEMKKFLFFWCIFHLIGYVSFLVGITPHFDNGEDSSGINYIITPEYIPTAYDNSLQVEEYMEEYNFYPFHRFVEKNSYQVPIFVGVWGYYGHYEFLVYVVLPLLIYLLMIFYRRFIADKK